jgi:DUF4097 and DUF4098 domain-containing protein YvlB
MFNGRVGLALIAALVGAPGSARAQVNGRTSIDTILAFDKGGTVSLGSGSATIIVTAWDQNSIRIRARAEDGLLRVETSARRVSVQPTRSSDDAMIEVTVPRGVRVEAHLTDGDISIRGTRGSVEATTSSGDLQVSDATSVTAESLSGDVYVSQATGAVIATTSNGDLDIRDCSGSVDATSVSGGIDISRSSARSVKANVTSGDIHFSGALTAQGTYSLTTHSGDVEIELDKHASAQVDASTWSGEIDSEFPVILKPGSSRTGSNPAKHFTFTIGAGSAKFSAETFSGDIVLRAKGG